MAVNGLCAIAARPKPTAASRNPPNPIKRRAHFKLPIAGTNQSESAPPARQPRVPAARGNAEYTPDLCTVSP